jgi:hypothetical protein
MINRTLAGRWSLLTVFALSVLTGLMINGCFFTEQMDEGDGIKQVIYPEPDVENWLNSVWGSGANDVWAVGQHGAVLHFNGTAWSLEQLDADNLADIWGTAANDVYTCGDKGALFHYNGSSWRKLTSGTTENLRAVGTGPYDAIYACGDNGTIRQKSGSSWIDTEEFAYRFSARSEPIDTLDFLFNMDGFSTVSPYCIAGDSASIVMENNREDSPYQWTWATTEDKYSRFIRVSIGDADNISLNFMANTAGEILRLGVDSTGALSWMYPRTAEQYVCRPVTTPAPITGIWLNPADNLTLYLTTEWGNIATLQSDCTGTAQVYQHNTWLSDIWGTDEGTDIYAVGRFGVILHSTDGLTWLELEDVPLPE